MRSRPHLFLLLSSLLAIVAYLLAPVFRLVIIGVSGLKAIQLVNFWFLLPVLLMAIVGIIALFGNKAISLTSAGVLSLVMLLYLFLMKDLVKGGNASALLAQISMDQTTSTITDLTVTVFTNPAWGFILSFLLVLAGAVLTAVLPDGSSGSSSHGHSSRGGNSGGSGSRSSARSSSNSSYNKLY